QYLKTRYVVDTSGTDRYVNNGFRSFAFPSSDDKSKQHEQIIIYPNPVSDILSVETKTNALNNLMIILFDLNGRQVLKEGIKGQKNTVDISSLPQGVYMVEIIQENKSIHKQKITKQ